MTSKQRAKLKSLASKLDSAFQIGKGNVGDAMLKSLDEALEKRELVKITVLKTSDYTAAELCDELAKELNAISVQAIGSKIVLYRRSKNKDAQHIEL